MCYAYTLKKKIKTEQRHSTVNFLVYPVVKDSLTVRFTKLLTNCFRSSFEIPEVRYELSNFIA